LIGFGPKQAIKREKWLLFQVLTKEKWETTGRSGESTGRSQNISLINCATFHIRGALSWHSYVIMYLLYIKVYFIYWTIVDYHICAFIICARQSKESEKGLLNTNKQKTNTRTYVNQRDDKFCSSWPIFQGSHYFEIRGRSDFSFRC
jgi:hypothetical protein